jgi:hypothetical protein
MRNLENWSLEIDGSRTKPDNVKYEPSKLVGSDKRNFRTQTPKNTGPPPRLMSRLASLRE